MQCYQESNPEAEHGGLYGQAAVSLMAQSDCPKSSFILELTLQSLDKIGVELDATVVFDVQVNTIQDNRAKGPVGSTPSKIRVPDAAGSTAAHAFSLQEPFMTCQPMEFEVHKVHLNCKARLKI